MSASNFIFNVIRKMRGTKKSVQHDHFSKDIFNAPVAKTVTNYDFPESSPASLQKIKAKLIRYQQQITFKTWMYTGLIVSSLLLLYMLIF